MTVADIIKAVRWCVDEESNNDTSLSSVIDEKDDAYMDNLIRSKIGDAIRWACLVAPAGMLAGGAASVNTLGLTQDLVLLKGSSSTSGNSKYVDYNTTFDIGVVTMPTSMNFVRCIRVRGEGWYKAVLNPVDEDSEEELAMFDETARGTADRPQAAIMNTTPIKILVQPASKTIELTVCTIPDAIASDVSESTDIAVPQKIRGAVIYYIAFLLMSAYGDSRATNMYSIAAQQLGLVTVK